MIFYLPEEEGMRSAYMCLDFRRVLFRSVHVVVVDDERDIRGTVAEYLELNGYKVSKAEGGAALRRIVEQGRVDLAALDVTMPGEDGLSLARWLRDHGGGGVIMLPARDSVVARLGGIQMGAEDYVTKTLQLRSEVSRGGTRRCRSGYT